VLPNRRLLLFLGVFSLLLVALVGGSSLLVQTDVLRVRGHIVIGLASLVPLVLYLVLSLRYIAGVKG
jgi:hypothetical protein